MKKQDKVKNNEKQEDRETAVNRDRFMEDQDNWVVHADFNITLLNIFMEIKDDTENFRWEMETKKVKRKYKLKNTLIEIKSYVYALLNIHSTILCGVIQTPN